MSCPYTSKYGAPPLFSTTIQEEDEEDLNDGPTGAQQRAPAHNTNCKRNPTANREQSSLAASPRPDRDRRPCHVALSAVARVASKIASRLWHSEQPGDPHGKTSSQSALHGGTTCIACKAPKCKAQAQRAECNAGSARSQSHKGSSGILCAASRGNGPMTSDIGGARAARHHHYQPKPPAAEESRTAHLVRLMDGDDVRLAMQALQVAAQIHDHVWGPAASVAANDPRGREALLEAATPLYDMAMGAARAIQHRALHSLVKQAVRRYVDPSRGAPDDVLRVILELLTGCGGAAPSKRAASRCVSDLANGYRASDSPSVVVAATTAAVATAVEEPASPTSGGCSSEDCWRGAVMESVLECSNDVAASRGSPTSHCQRMSFSSSSLGGRSSTRSSLESSSSDSSSLPLVYPGPRT